jgi:hypothetical protein
VYKIVGHIDLIGEFWQWGATMDTKDILENFKIIFQ